MLNEELSCFVLLFTEEENVNNRKNAYRIENSETDEPG
jgi:hypothetical protein